MASDLFGRSDVKLGGAMSAEATKVTFSEMSTTGLLLQRLQIQYAQQVSRIYALDTPHTYLIAGRTEGQMEANQVLGPSGVMTAFYKKYADVCNVTGILNISAEAGCHSGEGGSKMAVTVTNPVIDQFTLSMEAQNMQLGVGLRMMFISLDVS